LAAAMEKMSYYAACLEELGGAENATDRALLRCVTTALETGRHDDIVKTKAMLLVYASALVFFMRKTPVRFCPCPWFLGWFDSGAPPSNESRNAIAHRATICC
jgi:hypothetical protein